MSLPEVARAVTALLDNSMLAQKIESAPHGGSRQAKDGTEI